MKTIVFSAHEYEIPFIKNANGDKHKLIFTNQKLSIESCELSVGFEAVAVFTADNVSSIVVERLHSLGVRHIALRSAGFDHVDLHACKSLNVSVANVPAYSPYSIAEHAITMLLAFNRRIVESQRLISSQDFRLDTLTGFDLHGKTVGIIGTGTIGIIFSKIMIGFGAKIIACDPVQNADAINMGVNYVSFESLLTNCDVISIHCPLNEKTRYMFSSKEFSKMKKGCIIINTARGAVINTEHLLDAIDAGQIGGACLDVYEKEKSIFFEDHRDEKIEDDLFLRLHANKNVLLTGHQAFLTREALQGIAETTIYNLDCWQSHRPSPHELTQ